MALACLLAQGEDIITIRGTKRITYQEENIAAENVQLGEADLTAIEALMPAGSVLARVTRKVRWFPE